MNLTERLDKHLKSIKEISELNGPEIEKALYKYADTKNLGKLIWSLIRPTVQAGGGRFITPNFNDIKQPLLADIKDTVALMIKDTPDWDRNEVKEFLIVPDKYDEEMGNYADTSFGDGIEDFLKKHREFANISKYSQDMIDYLDREIKRNYKSFYNQI